MVLCVLEFTFRMFGGGNVTHLRDIGKESLTYTLKVYLSEVMNLEVLEVWFEFSNTYTCSNVTT